MEVILFPAAFAAMVVALFIKSKYYPLFIAMGYTIFGAAAVHCLFDIVRRLDANDIGGIEDIYPTMKGAYLSLLIFISIMAVVAVLFHTRKGK